ncbi:TD and POZ domain-containing protein 1 [Argiope bruennichi]|uniref:TD and POZ domain-containing protein 1 n=1 Tax=Argiope bruennichi TaxID=94029 RepID=A0A8T0EHN2_ARGBR|nr:TD and POZ domain-containing protein 1 [Argiope bruennichi]
MTESRKCFTFIWKIKNFSFCFNGKCILSPSFDAQTLDGIKWEVGISFNIEKNVACLISAREYNASVLKWPELDFELSFLAGDGSVLHSKIFIKKILQYPDFSLLYVIKDKTFFHQKHLFIPGDTLTVRCRMWKSGESISQSEMCFAETQIETFSSKAFVGSIKRFSSLQAGEKYPLCVKSPSTEISFCSTNLSIVSDGKLEVEVIPISRPFVIFYYRCKIFILDRRGNKVKSGDGEFYDTQSHSIPLTFSKDYLVNSKEYFLPNDELTICCDFILPGTKAEQELKHIYDCQDMNEITSNINNQDESSEKPRIENSATLKDDLISLLNEGIFCDTKLKTATKTFPAHIAVLSARSQVFKSMFATDIRVKMDNCVGIDDLDADTVRRMLLFIYSDTLDDLDYESAKSLYFAADKYSIVSLKLRCSRFLKQKLLQSNCCDVLLLADRHQDNDLKKAVQEYIAKNGEEVLFSDEWKNLEKDHSLLTIEVLRFMYLKNRRN